MNRLKRIVLLLIRFYQLAISPMFPPRCRFIPSCSQYAVEAVSRFGVLYGLWLATKRIVKCGPWHHGGFDPVPTER